MSFNSQRKKEAAALHNRLLEIEQARLSKLTPEQKREEVIQNVVTQQLKMMRGSIDKTVGTN